MIIITMAKRDNYLHTNNINVNGLNPPFFFGVFSPINNPFATSGIVCTDSVAILPVCLPTQAQSSARSSWQQVGVDSR